MSNDTILYAGNVAIFPSQGNECAIPRRLPVHEIPKFYGVISLPINQFVSTGEKFYTIVQYPANLPPIDPELTLEFSAWEAASDEAMGCCDAEL